MSHFTVMVIGDDFEKQLQPYHEFECTGIDDQYVKEIDVTEENRKHFIEGTKRFYVDSNGNRHYPYNDKFYREPTKEESEEIGTIAGTGCCKDFSYTSRDWGDGKGYRSKIHYLPERFTEIEIPYAEVYSFYEYLTECEDIAPLEIGETPTDDHKYEYVLHDNKEVIQVIRRTNPNAKWDWYMVGGRWTGYFKLKENGIGEMGEKSWASSPTENGYVDKLYKKDIDIIGMEKEAIEKAEKEWDYIHEAIKSYEKPNKWKYYLDSINDDYPMDQARIDYKNQDAIKAFREVTNKNDSPVSPFTMINDFLLSKEDYVTIAKNSIITPFAFVKDSTWYEKGKMGWWSIVQDEKEQTDWNTKFMKMFKELPDDTLITIVDCHI